MRRQSRCCWPRWTALLLASATAAALLGGCGAALTADSGASTGQSASHPEPSSSVASPAPPRDDALPEHTPVNPEQGSFDEAAAALCEALRSSDPTALAALAQLPPEPFAPLATAAISDAEAAFSGERNAVGAEMYVVTLELDQPGALPYAAGRQVFYAWIGDDARYGTGAGAVLLQLISGAIDEADAEVRASDAVTTLEPLTAILEPLSFESWETLLAEETVIPADGRDGVFRLTEALLYLLRVLTPDGAAREDFSEQEVRTAAKSYLGLDAFDGTGTPLWDAARGVYVPQGRGLPDLYVAYIGAGAAGDGRTEVRQLVFADRLRFLPDSLYLYRQERNEEGGWRVLSGEKLSPVIASQLPPARQAAEYDAAADALCAALNESDADALQRLSIEDLAGVYDCLTDAVITGAAAERVDPRETGSATYRITLRLERPGGLPYTAGEQELLARFRDGGGRGETGVFLERLVHASFTELFARHQAVRKSGVTATIDWVTGTCASCPAFSDWADFARQYGKEKLTRIAVDLTRYLLLDGVDRFAFTEEEVRQAAFKYLGLKAFDGADTALWDADNQQYDQWGWGMVDNHALYAGQTERTDEGVDVTQWVFADALYFLPQAVRVYRQTPNEDGSWRLLSVLDATPEGAADGWPLPPQAAAE